MPRLNFCLRLQCLGSFPVFVQVLCSFLVLCLCKHVLDRGAGTWVLLTHTPCALYSPGHSHALCPVQPCSPRCPVPCTALLTHTPCALYSPAHSHALCPVQPCSHTRPVPCTALLTHTPCTLYSPAQTHALCPVQPCSLTRPVPCTSGPSSSMKGIGHWLQSRTFVYFLRTCCLWLAWGFGMGPSPT